MNDKFTFGTSTWICIGCAVIWIIFYVATLKFTGLKSFIPFAMFLLIGSLGSVTVINALIKIHRSWKDLKSYERIKVYNLCLVSISLYSLFLLGCMKYNKSLIYSLYIVIAAIVAIAIIGNELDHYFPKKSKTKYVQLNIPSQNVTDEKGNNITIKSHKIQAKVNK